MVTISEHALYVTIIVVGAFCYRVLFLCIYNLSRLQRIILVLTVMFTCNNRFFPSIPNKRLYNIAFVKRSKVGILWTKNIIFYSTYCIRKLKIRLQTIFFLIYPICGLEFLGFYINRLVNICRLKHKSHNISYRIRL